MTAWGFAAVIVVCLLVAWCWAFAVIAYARHRPTRDVHHAVPMNRTQRRSLKHRGVR